MCQSGKRILQEKYAKEADSKKEKVKQLTEKASRLAQEYKIKREEISDKEVELSDWQKQLIKHEKEYEDIIESRKETQSILKQVSDCGKKMLACKEQIKNLEYDIPKRIEELKAIVVAIISCKVQLKITLNELSHCQEMLKVNKESMDDERIKRLQDKSTAQKKRTAAATTFIAGWGAGVLSVLSGYILIMLL
jgi:chromosome segregation ATPase